MNTQGAETSAIGTEEDDDDDEEAAASVPAPRADHTKSIYMWSVTDPFLHQLVILMVVGVPGLFTETK